ncbi:DUF3826 domain-containing protein [Terrimonas ferruginea]|uniref:DUF3826 domain-containing protein n=1 Tax=Terrimonas ferruginea TaxID=249 RepID=UPI000420C66A|nr:DUF3826 domain-containing protein [Terrimonas ferruginea]
MKLPRIAMILLVRRTSVAFTFLLLAITGIANAQEADTVAYRKVVTERSAKIVKTLSINDSAAYYRVVNKIADQYIALNKVHDGSKAAVTALKQQNLSKEELATAVKKEEENKNASLRQLHTSFIKLLSADLNTAQVEKVKDGMTYGVLPLTWTAYQDMLPNLTKQQKEQIYAYLVEARELAMDEGTSDNKHKVFGKYKGKINNYLSAAGYDMKKEGEEWQKRIKEREAAKAPKG